MRTALNSLEMRDDMKPLPPLPLHPPKKSPEYLAYIREKPCIICDNPETVAHHEPPRGMGGGRSTDWETAPLCFECHAIRHGEKVKHHEAKYDSRAVWTMCENARVGLLIEYIQRKGL